MLHVPTMSPPQAPESEQIDNVLGLDHACRQRRAAKAIEQVRLDMHVWEEQIVLKNVA